MKVEINKNKNILLGAWAQTPTPRPIHPTFMPSAQRPSTPTVGPRAQSPFSATCSWGQGGQPPDSTRESLLPQQDSLARQQALRTCRLRPLAGGGQHRSRTKLTRQLTGGSASTRASSTEGCYHYAELPEICSASQPCFRFFPCPINASVAISLAVKHANQTTSEAVGESEREVRNREPPSRLE
jgi:hypothetical protein